MPLLCGRAGVTAFRKPALHERPHVRPVARAEPRQAGTRDGSFACARKLVAVAALTTEQSQQTHEARTDGGHDQHEFDRLAQDLLGGGLARVLGLFAQLVFTFT